jgi:uncharacterized protein (DUF2236 family)
VTSLSIPVLSSLGAGLTAVPVMRMQPMPMHDRAPDPGLFGPRSVTWRVVREPILVTGGGRALLMQAAHPMVAQGAIDHSTYRTDPYGRLLRTLEWVAVCSFGTRAEARAACRAVNRLHRHVRGHLPRGHGAGAHPAGRPYSALDPHLLRWVHATLVDTMLVTHDALIGGLSREEKDRFVREWNEVAALMGVRSEDRFRSRAELSDYVDDEIRSGRVSPGRGSLKVAETVLGPPLPSVLAVPGWRLVVFAAVGLLPSGLRHRYGISWSPIHEAAHRALCGTIRTTLPGVPRRLRVSPAHEWALRRVGEGTAPGRGTDRGASGGREGFGGHRRNRKKSFLFLSRVP